LGGARSNGLLLACMPEILSITPSAGDAVIAHQSLTLLLIAHRRRCRRRRTSRYDRGYTRWEKFDVDSALVSGSDDEDEEEEEAEEPLFAASADAAATAAATAASDRKLRLEDEARRRNLLGGSDGDGDRVPADRAAAAAVAPEATMGRPDGRGACTQPPPLPPVVDSTSCTPPLNDTTMGPEPEPEPEPEPIAASPGVAPPSTVSQKSAAQWKDEGNAAFKRGELQEAAAAYYRGLAALPPPPPKPLEPAAEEEGRAPRADLVKDSAELDPTVSPDERWQQWEAKVRELLIRSQLLIGHGGGGGGGRHSPAAATALPGQADDSRVVAGGCRHPTR
jgi:hypothetical protein